MKISIDDSAKTDDELRMNYLMQMSSSENFLLNCDDHAPNFILILFSMKHALNMHKQVNNIKMLLN